MNIAFFDFDGTITNKDSLADFIIFSVGSKNYYWGLFVNSPTLVLFLLKLLPNQEAKEKLFSYYFRGWRINRFQKIADEYSNTQINKIIRPEAIEKIEWHQKQGHKVVIVSASIENWLQSWCAQNNLQLIATKLEIRNNKITGSFSSPNCHGKEKTIRIKNTFNLSEYENIFAYGDSNGDKQMLDLANFKFMKPFRN